MSLIDDIKEMGVELTSEQESGITAYIGKHFVSKSDYNAKTTQLKDANGRIQELENVILHQSNRTVITGNRNMKVCRKTTRTSPKRKSSFHCWETTARTETICCTNMGESTSWNWMTKGKSKMVRISSRT